MKAIVYKSGQFQYSEYKGSFHPGFDGDVLVGLQYAALNKRDDFIVKGLYPGIIDNVIMGSDGMGILDGEEVLINPGLNWGDDPRVQGEEFEILGMPSNGTFTERVYVPSKNIYSKPSHLSPSEAAALPLAGLTAFRAVFTRGNLKSGQRILITGGGGGVATNCILFALAKDAEVFVTSGSSEKIEKLCSLGVKGGFNYRDTDWAGTIQKEVGFFDLIIDSAGGEGLSKLIGLVKPGGNLVLYGGTKGKAPAISPQLIFWRQINILGSTMGSHSDFRKMIDFVEEHQIKPLVDSIFKLEDFDKALLRLRSGDHLGKIVIKIH